MKQVLVDSRITLFCFGEKCMSCEISNVELMVSDQYRMEGSFIEPSYFISELNLNAIFPLREVSIRLGEGIILTVIN